MKEHESYTFFKDLKKFRCLFKIEIKNQSIDFIIYNIKEKGCGIFYHVFSILTIKILIFKGDII